MLFGGRQAQEQAAVGESGHNAFAPCRVMVILRRMLETRRLPPDHPDAAAPLALMADRFPYWHAGWDMPSDADRFVALYADGRALAGAALGVRADGLADVSRFSSVASREEVVGHALLAAVEQTARERGCERVRLDATAFLVLRRLPDEYRTGPPYGGDADVPVWAERRLTE